MHKKDLTAKDKVELRAMLDRLERSEGVLVSGGFYDRRVPGINDVGPGRKVNTPACRHLGYGLFKCGDIEFSGGGAMYRADTFSWTPVDGPVHETNYPFAEAEAAIRELLK